MLDDFTEGQMESLAFVLLLPARHLVAIGVPAEAYVVLGEPEA